MGGTRAGALAHERRQGKLGSDMDQPFDTARLLKLRKVTRAISDVLEKEVTEHLAVLSPLIQPRKVLGRHLAGSGKQAVRGEAEAFEQLQGVYASLAETRPFRLPRELESPLDLVHTSLEIGPAEFPYEAQSGQETRTITITPPLKWVLSFSGFGPQRLRRLIATQGKSTGNELQQCVLHYLILHVTLDRLRGVRRILASLRFSVTTSHSDEFGKLPVTYIECAVPTVRPPDEIIIQSTEISGTPAFEEVVDVDGIVMLHDPLKERLLELIQQNGSDLLANDASA